MSWSHKSKSTGFEGGLFLQDFPEITSGSNIVNKIQEFQKTLAYQTPINFTEEYEEEWRTPHCANKYILAHLMS